MSDKAEKIINLIETLFYMVILTLFGYGLSRFVLTPFEVKSYWLGLFIGFALSIFFIALAKRM